MHFSGQSWNFHLAQGRPDTFAPRVHYSKGRATEFRFNVAAFPILLERAQVDTAEPSRSNS